MEENGNGQPATPEQAYGEPAQAELALVQREMRALTSEILLDRIQFMRQAGITFDGARDEYEILGYDRIITGKQYRDEYSRGGIAGRVVDALPNATWRGQVELIEDEDPKKDTEFEKAWKDLDMQLKVQAKLQRADKLAGLSTYSILLIGAGGNLEEELPKGKPGGLLYLTPFSGGGGPGGSSRSRSVADDFTDATIFEFEVDPKSPRFGLPRSYQLKRTDVSSPFLQRPVHWSRVLHIAENVLDDEVYGQPALERVWNLLADLRKVTGGGAEAFWLRANQGLHLDIDKDMRLEDAKATLEALKAQSELYKHQQTRWLRTKGVAVETLGSDVANFQQPADTILTQISGAKGIPKRILTGSEMGELASTQDRDNWRDQVNGRQTGYAGPFIVRPLVDRLVHYGYLPTPKKGPMAYEVRWPHIETLTAKDKTEGAKAWASVNQMQGSKVFTDDEIRDTWADKEPLTAEQKQALADEAAAKLKQQQDAMAAAAPTDPGAPKPNPFAARAAEDEEILRVLTAALEAGNAEVVERIVGLGDVPGHEFHGNQWTGGTGHPDYPKAQKFADRYPVGTHLEKSSTEGYRSAIMPDVSHKDFIKMVNHHLGSKGLALVPNKGAAIVQSSRGGGTMGKATGWTIKALAEYKYGSTQVQLPPDVAERLFALGRTIDDADIYEPEGGRETDAHVTVKYGLIDPTPEQVFEVVARRGPITFTLGKTSMFTTKLYDVVFVSVRSTDLADLNAAITLGVETKESDHAAYLPHATVAYVQPGTGVKYAGLDALDGIEVTVDNIVLCDVDGSKTEVSLA